MPKEDDKGNKLLQIEETVEVPPSSVITSVVAGNPQNARIAVLNAGNQSVYLSSGSSSIIQGSGLIVSGPTIVEGETYEISQDIDERSSNYDLQIESVWVQNDELAQFSLNIISASYDMYYRNISLSVAPNPLIQIGDIAQLSIKTYSVNFPSDQYWIVSGIDHNFSNGMTTNLTLKPFKKIFGMVE